MGFFCVSRAKNVLSLSRCKRTEFHMPMLWRRYNGRKANCVQFLEEQDFLVGCVEASRVDGWCRAIKGRRPGAWILSVLMLRNHEAMDVSDWPRMDMVRWISHLNDWTKKMSWHRGIYYIPLTKYEITRQRLFELMNIEYDEIKDGITSTERV